MRVVFATWAWPSHLYALVPLAWAFRVAGHEVLVASEPGLAGEIEMAGLRPVTVGHDVDSVGMVRDYLVPGNGTGRPRAMEMLAAHAESMTGDLVDVVRQWRADLVVYEPTALAGPVAAAVADVPAVRHLYGVDLMHKAGTHLLDIMAPLGARYGIDRLDPFGVATVDPVPALVQVATGGPRLPMRCIPYNGPGSMAVEPPERRRRPRVCVTWGHTIAKLDPARFLLPHVVESIRMLDVDVVVVVSGEQLPLLGALPVEVEILVDTPLSLVLDGCDLVVGHGGAGTILTSLDRGLPMVLIPQLPDHKGHSAAVAAAGAGMVLPLEEATGPIIRDQVSRILASDGESGKAAAARDEMWRQPLPSAVVSRLESLSHRGTSRS
ncbi:nucleotide disphospho-sugar-binding domain-containing protein [Amycolatopsis sp. lyj-90]|uniref:nucleotide disphospho-sugar-binding domain-containing protein n=1 Tax=Amycolatopsis sp. lyj-90 TaxID=2789285 RepID=UPI00397D9C50